MNHINIIQDLIYWIDNNLDNPLTLNHVTKKSGYSKWHLQRMFKNATGQTLGSYIRKRRLTKAAVTLRLTNKAIIDIALQYHFDSQQSFSKAFKNLFKQTPNNYRRMRKWDKHELYPPIQIGVRHCYA